MRRNVLPPRRDDDILLSISELQQTVFIKFAYIARVKPTGLFNGFGGEFRILVITLENAVSPDENLSILAEIGNILVGIYLTAIHDFCKLHIYHTIPTVAVDMVQSLLDESLNVLSMQVQLMIVIENEFLVEKKHIRAFLIMIPSVESVKTLLDSIEQARMAYGEE